MPRASRPFLRVAASCVVASSLASLLAAPAAAEVQDADQAKCLTSVARGAAKAVRARVKDWQGCLADAAAAELTTCPEAEACLVADRSGKVGAALAKLGDTIAKSCTVAPDFGLRPLPRLETSILTETTGLLDDLFGADLDDALVLESADADAADCQARVAGRASKLMLAMGAAWDACKAAGLRDGTITGPASLAACLGAITADEKGKVAAARKGLDSTLAGGSCDGVALATALPGSCAAAPSIGDCIETRARCRACRRGAVGDDTGADCDAFDDGLANASCTGFSGRCNGRAELCDRGFDAVAYPTTHNAMTNREENWGQPNQRHGMDRQLADGIRSMMLDTYEYNGEIVMCHVWCDLGEPQGLTPREALTSGLAKIREHLEVDPGAVVSIIFESYITEAQAAQAFADAGLDALVHAQPLGDQWPTLGDLVQSGKRVVVFTDDSSASLPWHHYVWDHAWETPFSFGQVEDFTCAINRGTPGAPLYILNHFLTDNFGSLLLSQQANVDPLFTDRALQCQAEGGQIPNFVTVDYYDVGPLFEVVDTLNAIPRCAVP